MTSVACVLCHHHQVVFPAEVIPLEGGLIIQGPEESVRDIQGRLIDLGLLTGETPWQVAARLLGELLTGTIAQSSSTERPS